MSTLGPGQPVPSFDLPADDGRRYSSLGLLGSRYVLYFYPKDLTPGCTTQACEYEAASPKFRERGVLVLGVSRDSLSSHAKFRTKHGLSFPLLSDADATVHRAFGAWGMKTLYGKTSEGALRTTVVVGADGRIERIQQVKAAGDAERTLASL
jgi:peroxiredoxin Q/BCP